MNKLSNVGGCHVTRYAILAQAVKHILSRNLTLSALKIIINNNTKVRMWINAYIQAQTRKTASSFI